MNRNSDFGARAAVHAARLDQTPAPIPGVDRRMLDRIGDEVARATLDRSLGSAQPVLLAHPWRRREVLPVPLCLSTSGSQNLGAGWRLCQRRRGVYPALVAQTAGGGKAASHRGTERAAKSRSS